MQQNQLGFSNSLATLANGMALGASTQALSNPNLALTTASAPTGPANTAEFEFNKACSSAIAAFLAHYVFPAISAGNKRRFNVDYTLQQFQEDIKALHLSGPAGGMSIQSASLGGLMAAPTAEKTKKHVFPKLPPDVTRKCQYQKTRGNSRGQFCPDFAVQGYDYCNRCLATEKVIKELKDKGIPLPGQGPMGSSGVASNSFQLQPTNSFTAKPPAAATLGQFPIKPNSTPGVITPPVSSVQLLHIPGQEGLYEDNKYHFIVRDNPHGPNEPKIIMGIREGTGLRLLRPHEVQIANTIKEFQLHNDAIEKPAAAPAPQLAKPAATAPVQQKLQLPASAPTSQQHLSSLQASINHANNNAAAPPATVEDRLDSAPDQEPNQESDEVIGDGEPQFEPQLQLNGMAAQAAPVYQAPVQTQQAQVQQAPAPIQQAPVQQAQAPVQHHVQPQAPVQHHAQAQAQVQQHVQTQAQRPAQANSLPAFQMPNLTNKLQGLSLGQQPHQ